MTGEKQIEIRPECLLPAKEGWVAPTGKEIAEIIRRLGWSQSETGRFLNISVQTTGGCRMVRRWIKEEFRIQFSEWAILCHEAGLGMIWKRAESDKSK